MANYLDFVAHKNGVRQVKGKDNIWIWRTEREYYCNGDKILCIRALLVNLRWFNRIPHSRYTTVDTFR